MFFSCCLEENQLEPTVRDCWRSYFSCPNLVTSFAYFAGLQETSLRTAWSPLLRQLEAKQPGCSGNQPRSLDWEKKIVSDLPDSAWSDGCIDWSSLTTSEPLDLLEIPLDYHKFTNTFSKSGAYIRAPHCEHDLKIELKEEASPPLGTTYFLSLSELEFFVPSSTNTLLWDSFVPPHLVMLPWFSSSTRRMVSSIFASTSEDWTKSWRKTNTCTPKSLTC